MAAKSWGTDPPLEQVLFEEGYRFDFFQAVRLLERAAEAEPEHHRDTIQGPGAGDEPQELTELLPEPDHALPHVGHTTVSSTDIPQQSGAEDASPDLGDTKGDDDCNPASVAQELSPEEVECEAGRSAAEGHIVPSDDASPPAIDPIEQPSQTMPGDARHLREHDNQIAATEALASTIDAQVPDIQGEATMLDQAELERTKKEIESRRDEMLDRHSKELKELLAKQADELSCLKNDRDELEALDAAISAALRKFKGPSADAGVTRLEVVS